MANRKMKIALVGVIAAVILAAAALLLLLSGPSNKSQMIVVTPESIAAAAPQWRRNFDAVYRLDEGEIVRHIPTPYIPERETWARAERINGDYFVPDWPMGFRWDGTLHNYSLGGGGSTLLTAFEECRYDIDNVAFGPEGSASLKHLPLPGDWIIRKDADEDQRIAALQQVVVKELKRPIAIVKRHLERDVIVASGQFQLHPLPQVKDKRYLWLFTDSIVESSPRGGGSGSLAKLLQRIGDYTQRYVVNESTSPPALQVRWRHAQSLSPVHSGDDTLRNQLLDNLASQTSLTFRKERRMVDVWCIEEPTRP
jgi:hypothetical protein